MVGSIDLFDRDREPIMFRIKVFTRQCYFRSKRQGTAALGDGYPTRRLILHILSDQPSPHIEITVLFVRKLDSSLIPDAVAHLILVSPAGRSGIPARSRTALTASCTD